MNARYVPGDRVVALTGRAVVMAAPDRVAEVSALVDGAPTPLGVISALSGGDVARLPDFAAAVLDGTDLVVLVRGPYTVRCGGQQWSGRDVATWREHRVPAGDDVSIDHDEGEGDLELPLTAGVVLAARASWRPGEAPEEDECPPRATQDPGITVAEVEDAPEAVPDHDAEVDDGFDETVGATIQGQRVPDPAQVPVPDQAPDPAEGDHDGRTITAEQMRALRAREEPETPAATSQVTATLAVSGGETVDLAKPVIIGRSPRAERKSGAQLPRMMVVDDPYVSGTHLEVAVEDGAVVVTDRSTNGTMLTRPGGEPERLSTDEPTVVDDGCVLRLSDDVVATVMMHGAVG